MRRYLDHAASSPLDPVAEQAMLAVLGRPGNPSSLHGSGRAMRKLLEEARESLAADLGAHPSEVLFTSGGTEANNLALLGGTSEAVAISAIEHPSVAEVVRHRRTVELPVTDTGHLDLAAAEELVVAGVPLVSVMWVNNETGAIQPISQVVDLAHRVGALAHSDAVQGFGHLAIDVAATGVDLLSVSAHKLGGPVGIGALIRRRGVALHSVGFGGGQEAKLRSGTLPVALAVGFAAASRAAQERREAEATRLAQLRDLLVGSVAGLPGVSLNSIDAVPAIVNLTFDGVRADDMLLLLDAAGFDASTGSACTAGVHQPSEVLLAMGRSVEAASSSLRFSFGPTTSESDVTALVGVLPQIYDQARAAH